MKKQMKWLLAALALAALATPAFAVTADMTGTLAVRALSVNNFDGNDDNQDHGRFMDQRFRLFTSVAANENVKAVIGLEVDNVLGRTDKAGAATTIPVVGGTGTVTIPGAAAGKDLGALGTDKTAALEIKHLYLDFKIPALGANVRAGSQPFNFGRGMIINDDAAGLLLTMPCKIYPDNKIELSWIKTSEATAASGEDDGDFYGAKYSLNVAGIGVAPYIGYYTAGVGALTKSQTDASFYGVDVDGKTGPFGYAVTAIFNNWNNAATDGSSISLYGKGTMDMGDTTLSLEAARMGDVDNGGNSMSLAQNAATGPIVNVSEILTGGMYTTTSTLFANAGGAPSLYLTNWLYAKVGVVQKLSDAMKVSAYLAHIQQASDNKNTGPVVIDAITFGQELDTYFDYTIVPGLGVNVAAAYLLADSDFGNGDDAWKLATSLNYKF
jgi:hypothetical protein